MTEAEFVKKRWFTTSSCLFWDECSDEQKYDSFESVLNNGMQAIKVTDFGNNCKEKHWGFDIRHT
jgi:hypothetical protein